MSNWTDPPPKPRRHEPDFDEQVMMVALSVLANARVIDVMPFTPVVGVSADQLRERARQLVQEYDRA